MLHSVVISRENGHFVPRLIGRKARQVAISRENDHFVPRLIGRKAQQVAISRLSCIGFDRKSFHTKQSL